MVMQDLRPISEIQFDLNKLFKVENAGSAGDRVAMRARVDVPLYQRSQLSHVACTILYLMTDKN